MVRDERAEAASTWTHEERNARREGHVDKRHGVHSDKDRGGHGEHPVDKHREVDRELRRIATQRTGLDAQEARWLREAERHQIWRRLGFSTALEYLEDVFGYAPRTAMERLRVAKELGELPELEAELASGALPYSAAKELSRVMTRQTQTEWLARARGKNLRDIEEMVAGRKKGDRPDDLPDPALVVHDIRLKLTARTKALWEQMRAALERECDGHLDDDQLVEVVTRRVLGGDDAPSDKPPRPPHRIVVHQCDDCGRAWQEGRGRWIELSEADRALAACDAVIVHEHEQAASSATTSDIPAKTRKRVWTRDRGRCRVPGCRATRHIDIHHLIPRALGGTHDEWSLCLLCSGHHKLHHEGILSISGRAPDELVFIRDGKRLVDARSDAEASAVAALPSTAAAPSNRFAEVTKLEHAKQALRQLGFKARAARAALEQATAHVGTDADVAQLVHAALQLSRPDAPEVTAAATRDTVGGDEMTKLATQALVQLGYPRPIAINAVNAANAHVGGGDLVTLIKEALRRTSS
jgi:Holliday junction resolvasome RuvABC DNA-binding subunit